MNIKLKTISGKYIKVPIEIINQIAINRKISFANCNPRPIRNDEPVSCEIELLDGGNIYVDITNRYEVIEKFSKFIEEKIKMQNEIRKQEIQILKRLITLNKEYQSLVKYY